MQLVENNATKLSSSVKLGKFRFSSCFFADDVNTHIVPNDATLRGVCLMGRDYNMKIASEPMQSFDKTLLKLEMIFF